jgi:type IV secretory pathway TraG/TraD family ATPase VirD4
MNNPINNLSKGLFKSRVLLKDIRTQLILMMIVFLSVFVVFGLMHYLQLDSIEQGFVITTLKGYFSNWIGMVGISFNAELITDHKEILLSKIHIPIIIATSIWLVLARVFYKLGKNQSTHKIMEGVNLIHPEEFQKRLGKNKSNLKIGNVNWYQYAEVQHLLICGDPGSGKSQLLNQLLQQLRNSDDIVIAYDIKGDFIRDFYNPEIDQILTPFDERSVTWNPWDDLDSDLQMEAFAEAVIKENTQDSFWSKAARMVLVAALKKGQSENWTFNQTIKFITQTNLEVLAKWFDNTSVASDFSNEKTAATIFSELKTQIMCLNYLPDVDNKPLTFSLKNWLDDNLSAQHTDYKKLKKPSGWLFLPIPEQFKAVGTPIIAAQLELLANHILSLPTNRNRRIWFIVDELASLPKLTILGRLLSQGRGYGVAAILAIQNLSQLKDKYGNNGANALTGLCSSLLSLRVSDPDTANYISRRCGKHIRKEQQNTQSHTKNNKSKGESDGQSEHIVERAAVSETLIMTLDDLNGVFLSKGISHPVSVKIEVQILTPKNIGFVPAKDLKTRGKAKVQNYSVSIETDPNELTEKSPGTKPSKWEV